MGVCFFVYFWYFRILQSETYSIYDTLWYDIATSEDTTKWNNFGATASYSSENGTTLSQDTDYRYQAKYDITEDIIIDFEVKIPSTSTSNPNLYVKGMAPYFGENPFTRDVWHHVLITCSNGTYTMYKDTISEQTKVVNGNYTVANKIFQFRVTNSELSFKNFKIYPI